MRYFQIIILNFFIPNIFFAAEPIRVERSTTSEKTTTRAKIAQERIKEEPRTAKIKSKADPQKIAIEPKKTTQEVVPARSPHEIDPKTGMSDFEYALKDAARKRQQNQTLTRTESLQDARKLYEKARIEHIKTSDFVLHLNTRYNNGHLSDYYGPGKHDEHSKELMQDLLAIDPYLAKKFMDSFVDPKSKAKVKSVVTEENFITWLEKNPEYIINPAKFTGKANEKTPIEDAIELKDPTLIQEIIRIAKEHGISSDQLIQPLKDKFLDLFHTEGGAQVTEYLKNITEIGAPELTKIIIRNTMRAELQRAIEAGDIENGKLALEIARENDVSLKFLTKPLVEKYTNLNKSSHKYLKQIYALEDDELSQFVYEQITATDKE